MELGRTLEGSRIEIGWKADEGRKEVGRKVIFIYVKIIITVLIIILADRILNKI